MESLKSSAGRQRNSQDSVERLAQILTDKKRQSKSQERIVNASTTQEKVRAAFEDKNWSSQNDRSISYAKVISQKILARRLCIKVLRGFQLALQKKEARQSLFVFQRKKAFFTAFARGIQKQRTLKFNA